MRQGRIEDLLKRGPWRARGARAGSLGQSPQRGPGAEPWCEGNGEAPQAESFSSIFIQMGQTFSI